MAVAGTNVVSGSSTVGASSYATGSWPPVAGRLYLATVTTRTGISVDPVQPTASSNGLTWVVVNSVVYDNASSSRRRVTTFRAMGASPSTGALTFDFAGQAQTAADWTVDEFTGMDTTGTNGSGAIVQSVTNLDATGAGTSLTATLAAFGSASNATFGAFGYGNPPNASTAGSGFAKLGDQQDGGSGCRLTTEFNAGNDTTVDMSFAAGGEIGAIAIEIKVPSVGVSNNSAAFVGFF